jgi:hypothetical protein
MAELSSEDRRGFCGVLLATSYKAWHDINLHQRQPLNFERTAGQKHISQTPAAVASCHKPYGLCESAALPLEVATDAHQ